MCLAKRQRRKRNRTTARKHSPKVCSHGLEVDSLTQNANGCWQVIDLTTMDKAFGKLPSQKVKLLKSRQVPVDSGEPGFQKIVDGFLLQPGLPNVESEIDKEDWSLV